MTGLIYSIKVNELVYSRLHVLEVKIGKTTNINSILAQYRRSHMLMEILDLWKPNESLQLSECEKGVHQLAEKYAHERDSEKFIFLQNTYKTFSEHVSLFLEKTSDDETSDTISNKKREKYKHETGKRINFTGKIPKTIEFKNQIYQIHYWREILLIISKKLYEEKKDEFSKVLQLKGSKRTYYSKDGREKRQGGILIVPIKIPDTPFYFEGNISANQVVSITEDLLVLFGYNPSDIKIELI